MGEKIKKAIMICVVFVILVILNMLGFSSLIFSLIFLVVLMVLGQYIGIKVETKFAKATQEELNREDDVLLQATAFSQSVLIIIASQMLSENRLSITLLTLTIIVTVAFYTLRAWAKIKNSQKHRYYSMVAFALLSSNSAFSFIALVFKLPDTYIIDLPTIYLGVSTALAIIAGKIARRRYGYRGRLLSFAD